MRNEQQQPMLSEQDMVNIATEADASINLHSAHVALNKLYHETEGQPGFDEFADAYRLTEVAMRLLREGLVKRRAARKGRQQ